MRTDEWYNFRSNPRPQVHVLATLDESSYSGGEMGADHPIAWWHDYDGGRAWYTAVGHTGESYSEPLFLGHLLGGIEYAAGIGNAAGPAGPPRILSVSASVRGRRVAVTVKYAGCPGCSGELEIGKVRAPLHAREGVATGTSPPLRPGHFRVRVTLRDPAAAVRLTSTRPVVVR
jgi:hypothetical protein